MVIEADGVGRAYGERVVLREVSFKLAENRTLAIFGANGAGKTTLLRMLATLLRPHAGTLKVFDNELPRAGWAVRGKLGLLAHEPLLYRDLTARENLKYHARLHKVAPTRVDTVLEAVELSLRADEPVRLLSRGMIQRVAIARTVLHEPELLLLDEPFANLDPGVTEMVSPLLTGTRVLISHDIDEGLALADDVLGLRGARVAFHAPAAEVSAGDVRELYR